MQSVSGLNVPVTWAAMGLGKLFATQAVMEGAAAVVLSDANKAALKETVTELETGGARSITTLSTSPRSPRWPRPPGQVCVLRLRAYLRGPSCVAAHPGERGAARYRRVCR